MKKSFLFTILAWALTGCAEVPSPGCPACAQYPGHKK